MERRDRCCPGGRNNPQEAAARRGDRFGFVTVVTPTGRGDRPVQGNRTDHGEKRRVAGHLQAELDRLLQRDRRSATRPRPPAATIECARARSSTSRRRTSRTKTPRQTTPARSASKPPSAANCR